jgi:hypothetical protein
MSKATRAQTTSGATPTPTTLRPSAQPLNPAPQQDDPDAIPAHTEPFKAFDWIDDLPQVDPLTRALVNDTINVCTGVALVLRIVERIEVDADFSPESVTLSDGTELDQPVAPFLSANDCAALRSLAAASANMLTDRAHAYADDLRRRGRMQANRAGG